MTSHDRIWSAIDAIAARHGLTVSGLARRAGLDATAFNRSKRIGIGGRLRWPTTESIAKVLEATGTSPDLLAQLLCPPPPRPPRRRAAAPPPVFLSADEAADVLGPMTAGRRSLLVYRVADDRFVPVWPAGTRLVLDTKAPILRGDRVLAVDRTGDVTGGEVADWSDTLALAIPGGRGDIRMKRRNLSFAARIIWASQ